MNHLNFCSMLFSSSHFKFYYFIDYCCNYKNVYKIYSHNYALLHKQKYILVLLLFTYLHIPTYVHMSSINLLYSIRCILLHKWQLVWYISAYDHKILLQNGVRFIVYSYISPLCNCLCCYEF